MEKPNEQSGNKNLPTVIQDHTTYNILESQGFVEPKFREKVAICVSHKRVETLLLIVIIIYSALIFVRISFEDDIEDAEVYMNAIELVILISFVFEFLIKIYAFRLKFIKDCWNIFDMFIVCLCFALTIIELDNSSLSDNQYFRVSGTLRLLRLLVLFRRLNLMRKINQKRKTRTKLSAINVSNSAEKVMELLEMLINSELAESNTDLKRELLWALDVIAQNKLYELNIEASNDKERQKVEEWIDEPTQQKRGSALVSSFYIPETLDLDETPLSQIDILNLADHDFNVFEMGSEELLTVCLNCFKIKKLYQYTQIEPDTLKSFISAVQAGYLDNPYHNARHAADVVQFFYFLLNSCGGLSQCGFSPIDEAICLLSAAVHDFQHPGRNNLFLINTRHTLAVLYNDKSVLENHHIAAAFQLATQPDKNIFQTFTGEQFKAFRSTMISIVLATDMARHFEDIGKFKNRFGNSLEIKDDVDKLLVMECMMHASDISNPTRPWNICKQWTELLLEEFFSQGDEERQIGLPISHLCDRYTVETSQSQVGFIDFIVEPVFSALALVIPPVQDIVIPSLHQNKEKWKELNKN